MERTSSAFSKALDTEAFFLAGQREIECERIKTLHFYNKKYKSEELDTKLTAMRCGTSSEYVLAVGGLAPMSDSKCLPVTAHPCYKRAHGKKAAHTIRERYICKRRREDQNVVQQTLLSTRTVHDGRCLDQCSHITLTKQKEIVAEGARPQVLSITMSFMEMMHRFGGQTFFSTIEPYVGNELGKHKQGLTHPISANTDYTKSVLKRPGLGYLDRWKVAGKVPDKYLDSIVEEAVFYTADEAHEMFAEFERMEGEKMFELVVHELDSAVEGRREALMRAAERGPHGVINRGSYLVKGTLRASLVFRAGEAIVVNGKTVRDQMARFLMPGQDCCGEVIPMQNASRLSRVRLVNRLKNRLGYPMRELQAVVGQMVEGGFPSSVYRALGLAYNNCIGCGHELALTRWPQGAADERAFMQMLMDRLSHWFSGLLQLCYEHDDSLRQQLQNDP